MRLLLISNFFPPANVIAAHRIYSFARYLPEFGIEVEVITPKRSGKLELDLDGIPVHYPLEDRSPVNKFVKKKNRLRDILKYSGVRSFRYYLTSPFYHAAKRMLTPEFLGRFDAIMVSFGNEDAMRIAHLAHKRSGLPLLVDYRDLWYDNLYMNWTPLDKLVIEILEKRILKKTKLVTTVSKHLAHQLKKRYGVNPAVIYNGYLDFIWEMPAKQREMDDKIHFCYCGSLYGGIQPIETFLPLLRQHANYVLDIAVLDEIDRELVLTLSKKYEVEDQVNLYIDLSYQEAIALEKAADYLLFLNRLDGIARGVLTGKLFEYIAIGKYIVGIGNKNDEVGDLIREYNLGCYCDSLEDLSQILSGQAKSFSPSGRALEFFNRREQARLLAELIREKIS